MVWKLACLIQVDRPQVKALGVVAQDTLKDAASALRRPRLELQQPRLRDRLRKAARLQPPSQPSQGVQTHACDCHHCARLPSGALQKAKLAISDAAIARQGSLMRVLLPPFRAGEQVSMLTACVCKKAARKPAHLDVLPARQALKRSVQGLARAFAVALVQVHRDSSEPDLPARPDDQRQ